MPLGNLLGPHPKDISLSLFFLSRSLSVHAGIIALLSKFSMPTLSPDAKTSMYEVGEDVGVWWYLGL